MNWSCSNLLAALASLAALAANPAVAQQAEVPVAEIGSHTHIHGLAVDRASGGALLIATHHGLYRAAPDGKAKLISIVQDFMGFSPHPRDPLYFYASGHPAKGGNLGFIVSGDGGKNWQIVSFGADGPVDFHQMTVSRADPQVIYGAYKTMQVSRDGGKNWSIAGNRPPKLIDFAASARETATVYAATETGLSVSRDGAKSFSSVFEGAPVTMVEIAPSGEVFAFRIGTGLMKATEETLQFETLSADWPDSYLLHLAVDPNDPNRMFAATGDSIVFESSDGGRSWRRFGAK